MEENNELEEKKNESEESKEIVTSNPEEVINEETVNKTENVIDSNDSNADQEDEKTANRYTLISVFLIFLTPIVTDIISTMSDSYSSTASLNVLRKVGVVVGLTLLIYTRVKYPKNKASKTALIVFLIIAILSFIAIIVFFASCYTLIKSWPG